ncbi:unnamed protein product, partial [Heterotrigona itama]
RNWKTVRGNSEFIRWLANVKAIFPRVGSVIKYSPVSSAEQSSTFKKICCPASRCSKDSAPEAPSRIFTFPRYHLKVGDVMTTIRAEDDMALVSSTMARVFVNRWLLMTGCPSLVSQIYFVLSLLSQLGEGEGGGMYSLRNVLGEASISALCLIIQAPTRRNTMIGVINSISESSTGI